MGRDWFTQESSTNRSTSAVSHTCSEVSLPTKEWKSNLRSHVVLTITNPRSETKFIFHKFHSYFVLNVKTTRTKTLEWSIANYWQDCLLSLNLKYLFPFAFLWNKKLWLRRFRWLILVIRAQLCFKSGSQ